ncbi:ATP-binding protein [Anaerocolumna xylanovorans]|uniref:histidine kinase n=1 Tax=Anaerocolumna xylanovorans DSM 12503 TaxID=1121345 RepID=A0A1M7Y3J9_9FIRM|nr:ATP-binding protein [Anaerocolumna xylanovorans]SHO46720.1 PAS domain S-box-containing protein [Anaerocolumna xylanovorans DSM 12503]
MGKHKISLRQAILVPFAVIVLVVVSTFAILWNYDYERLAKKQGERVTQIMSTLIEDRVKALLQEPYMLSELSASYISQKNLFVQQDLKEIQDYELSVYKTLALSLPQIATISYGDENGNFAGIRLNNDNSYNLMLKDRRTQDKLIIYQGEDTDSEVISEFDGYDPRKRPWYTQAQSRTQEKWSDIYVNYDEKREATISTLVRIYDKSGKFTGVMCYDVSLEGLNEYLESQVQNNKGLIYIVDKNWNLIAQSTEDTQLNAEEASSTELISALKSNLPAIKESSEYFGALKILPDHIIRKEINNKINFMHVSQVGELGSLNWKIVILLPETELMGTMKAKQISLIILGVFITVLGSVIGLLIINSIIAPMTKSVSGASEISEGKYGIHIKSKKTIIKETSELLSAFNKMSDKLKEYFEKIKRKEEEYRTLVENVNNSIFSVAPDGSILSVNNVFEATTGWSRENIVGKHFSNIFKEQKHIDYFEERFAKVKENKERITFPYNFMGNDKNQRAYIIDFIPLLNENGELLRILGSTTDITELDKAQKEIRYLHEKEKERLQKLIREKSSELSQAMKEIMEMEKFASLGSLVSGVAHEINTPLGVAVSAASYMENTNSRTQELLQSGQMTKSEFIKYIDSMNETSFILNNNLRRAAELVKSFKQMAVNQSNEQKISFNFNGFLQTLLINLKHEYKNTGIQFVIDCDKDLLINSYPGAYSQIFTNLIMNSIIHAFPGKEGIIKIVIYTDADDITVQYSDNGKGIEKENLDKIFEPFFTTNRSGGGSGLGLSIVYNIVTAQLGGKITCESTLGSGTLFCIKIPIISEDKTYDKGLE